MLLRLGQGRTWIAWGGYGMLLLPKMKVNLRQMMLRRRYP